MAVFQYPNGKKKDSLSMPSHTSAESDPNYANRGMSLEDDLNQSNLFYSSRDIAVIHKKPTPIQIVSVEYPKRSAAVIREAYFKLASTTDYNGVYRGRYIDFEAKETKNKTSFPLKNFHEHQIAHMQSTARHGGICFVILQFSATNELYLLDSSVLAQYWMDKNEQRKSIPKTAIEKQGIPLQTGYAPRIDYLKAVDLLYFAK